MRIAVWYSLPFGGASRALHGQLTALREAGHQVEIWTSDLYPENSKQFEPFGKLHLVPMHQDAGSLQYHYKNPLSISKTREVIGILQSFQKTCAEQINRGGFDLAFVYSCSVSYMPFISRFLHIPSLLYLNEPFRWLYEASPKNGWQAPDVKPYQLLKRYRDYKTNYSRRIQVREEIKAAKAYSKILVNSLYSRESIYRAYGLDLEVSRLWVDTETFKISGSTVKEDYVVSVGLLYPPKGADRAVYLLSKLAPSLRPKLYWITVNPDVDYQQSVQQYARELGVEFIPLINLPDEALVEWVSKARFMIYTPRLEPFGLAPLEANACGTYVIGIAEGGVRETITHGRNGFLIDGVDDKTFSAYAEPLLKDKEAAVAMGRQARAFVEENWSYAHLKKNIVEAINSVVNKN